jgi:CHASE3 domain sensor protein
MSSLANLRIGTKLAITSAIGVMLVVAIVVVLINGNSAVRSANEFANRQQTIVADALDAKASVRGMQIGVRDLRLAAAPENLKSAMDYLEQRHKSTSKFADSVHSLAALPEQRERSQKLKSLADQYLAGAKEIEAVKRQVFALDSKSADTAARAAELNQQAGRIARERTLPLAAEAEKLANEIVEVAKHRAEAELAKAAAEMASAERISIGLVAATVIMLLASAIFLFLMIAKPVRALTGGMLELAGGNFDVVLPTSTPRSAGCRRRSRRSPPPPAKSPAPRRRSPPARPTSRSAPRSRPQGWRRPRPRWSRSPRR